MKKFIVALLFVFASSISSYADHKESHFCMNLVDFEKEFKEKNPGINFSTKTYSRIVTMNFIAFSAIELGVEPPDEDPSKITGLYYIHAEGYEKAFIAILNGDRICSNTTIDKKSFELLMKSLEGIQT